LALLGSLLISYTRARAEGLGADCKVGLVTRAERVLLITLGLCFGQIQAVIYLLVLLTAFTVGQRIQHTFRILHEKG
jgi:CDP-diacylglycerol--glycerol-3-phosphate 3-phosphatidyltransferase